MAKVSVAALGILAASKWKANTRESAVEETAASAVEMSAVKK